MQERTFAEPASARYRTTKKPKGRHGNTASMTIIANTDGQVRMDTHQETTLRLLDRIRNALTTPDSGDVDHAKLLADVSRLQLAIETPLETIYRIGHQVIV